MLFTHVESHASAVSLIESGDLCYIKAINNNNNNTHTHTHTRRVPFEDREPTGLKVDIASEYVSKGRFKNKTLKPRDVYQFSKPTINVNVPPSPSKLQHNFLILLLCAKQGPYCDCYRPHTIRLL